MDAFLNIAPFLTLVILGLLFYFLIKKGLGVFLVSAGIIAVIAGAAIRQQRWGLTKQWELEALNTWTIVGMILGGVLAAIGFALLYSNASSMRNRGSLEETEARQERRECPYCAELILKKARICKHCGKPIDQGSKPQDEEPDPAAIEDQCNGCFCYHCGAPVPSEATSCSSCGKKLEQDI